jgi:hypothetical protein
LGIATFSNYWLKGKGYFTIHVIFAGFGVGYFFISVSNLLGKELICYFRNQVENQKSWKKCK